MRGNRWLSRSNRTATAVRLGILRCHQCCRVNQIVGPKMKKERHGIPRMPGRLPVGIDHAVGGGSQHAARQPFEHIPDIDHQSTGRRIDRQPLTALRQQLQPGFLCAQQQCDRVDVAMRCGSVRCV